MILASVGEDEMKNVITELYKIRIARFDIKSAESSAMLLLKEFPEFNNSIYDNPLFYSLILSVVICYGRPFSENQPQGKLDHKYFEEIKDKYCKLHYKLNYKRNKVFAHSDANQHSDKLAFLVHYHPENLWPDGVKGYIPLSVTINPIYNFQRGEIEEIIKLCQDVSDILRKKEDSMLNMISDNLPDRVAEITVSGLIK